MSAKQVSYLSRLVEGAGKARPLAPPRVLFRPVVPMFERGFMEMESEAPATHAPESGRAREFASEPARTPSAVPEMPVATLKTSPIDQLTENRETSSDALPSVPDAGRSSMAPMAKINRTHANPAASSTPNTAVVKRAPFPVIADGGLGPAPIANAEMKTPRPNSHRDGRESMELATLDPRENSRRESIDPRAAHDVHDAGERPRKNRQSPRSESQSSNRLEAEGRSVLVPPPPSPPRASTSSASSRREQSADRGSAVRIGSLQVRISPPPAPAAPQQKLARAGSAPRQMASLARGFGSFGLVQG